MADIGDELGGAVTKKLGPLPAWAWAAIAAFVIVVVMYIKNRSTGGAATVVTPSDLTAAGINPDATGGGGSADPTVGQPTESLDDWDTAALAAAGGSPTGALAAINAFLAGQPLSSAQQSTVDSIIGKIGLPPNFSSLPASQPNSGAATSTDSGVSNSDVISSITDAISQSNSALVTAITSTPSNTSTAAVSTSQGLSASHLAAQKAADAAAIRAREAAQKATDTAAIRAQAAKNKAAGMTAAQVAAAQHAQAVAAQKTREAATHAAAVAAANKRAG